MKPIAKPVETLQVTDFSPNAVWQYVNSDTAGETVVTPVQYTPVTNLNGKLVGTRVRLANGDSVWALISNVDVKNARLSEHFLTISIERNSIWFHLPRYHDFNYGTHGPKALAEFLGLNVNEVFPISYDLTNYAIGDVAALSGKIFESPRERLTRAEVIAMAVGQS